MESADRALVNIFMNGIHLWYILYDGFKNREGASAEEPTSVMTKIVMPWDHGSDRVVTKTDV
eukprot:141088-Pleurochrysis_carterae.AAC.1